jgi:hypothetical protein
MQLVHAGKIAGGPMATTSNLVTLFSRSVTDSALDAGFRFGAKGTHTSRTLMLAELSAVLAAVLTGADRRQYAEAIIDLNCLAKATASTRRLTNQRLGELYGLDRSIPIFRVFRRLWDRDDPGRPLLAMLCAIARDPLLAATAPSVLSLPVEAQLLRQPMKDALRSVVGDRLNEATLDKVLRNAASSWAQSGHLEGRTFKKRRRVHATSANVAFALYLACTVGFRGPDLFTSGWMAVLDCSPSSGRQLALDAKRAGLIDLRMAAGVIELNLDRLDPKAARF